jgi:transposase
VRHSSVAIQQRGLKRQPLGGLTGEDGSPLRMRRRPSFPRSARVCGRCRQESLCVRMRWCFVAGLGVADFGNSAEVHHCHPIGDMSNDREVMGNEEDRDAEPRLKVCYGVLIKCDLGWFGHAGGVADRDEISDDVWAVIEPLLPRVTGRSRSWLEHRRVVEGVVWKYRAGAPWRDVPGRFGPWNTVFKRFDRWAKDGTWQRLLAAVQADSDGAGRLDWVVSIDSMITRVHQHGATLARTTGGFIELQESRAGAA